MPSNQKRHARGPRAGNGLPADSPADVVDAPPAEGAPPRGKGLDIGELKDMSIQKLTQVA
jgi:hypothetical protein